MKHKQKKNTPDKKMPKNLEVILKPKLLDKQWRSDFRKYFLNGFFILFTTEVLEALLETAITLVISSAVTQLVSFMLAVTATQTIKLVIKTWISPPLKAIIKIIVKNITQKEGNDKMEKLKKMIAWIKLNPKTIVSTIASFIACIAVGIAMVGSMITYNAPLPLWSQYLIGVIGGIIIFTLLEFGVLSAGLENKVKSTLRNLAKALGFDKVIEIIEPIKIAIDEENEVNRLAFEEIQKEEALAFLAEQEAKAIVLEAENQIKADELAVLDAKKQAIIQAKVTEMKYLKKIEAEKLASETIPSVEVDIANNLNSPIR